MLFFWTLYVKESDGIFDFWPKEKNRPGSVQHEGFTLLIIAKFDSLLNIPLYECARVPFMLTGKVRSNNALTGNFYALYLFLFAVALLCCNVL